MKTKLFWVICLFFIISGSNKENKHSNKFNTTELSETAVRKCASYEVLQEKLKQDPRLQNRMDEIEAFTQRYLNSPLARLEADGVTMTIPVYVKVLYRLPEENISDAQIQSQIDVLNEDFGGTNTDLFLTSDYNSVKATAGESKIRFELAGIERKQTTNSSWNTSDAMKSASRGGLNPTSPTTALNIWCCVMSNSILGYAQFPGGPSATDGIVITTQAFGSRAKHPSGYYMSTYDRGRTGTHEVGHYLGLRHIWGDQRCGNDLVGDTPAHDAANYGCPSNGHQSKCTGRPVEMTMNYMDYTADPCMYMFTDGQVARMRATFAAGGPRSGLR